MADTVIATEIARIESAKTTLKNKGVELGISLSTDKIDAIATKFNTSLVDQGSVTASVQEGESYTIPAGYHNGSGTVAGVAGGGSYTLQSKTVTPTKSTQAITSDSGYYGLDAVTVNPIPDAYQDVSGTTATSADVLVTKVFTAADGEVKTGSMPNIGEQTVVLDTTTTSMTISAGKHSGAGGVSISVETKSTTPTTSAQTITPTTGKVLSSVSVAAIPSAYQDVSSVDATAGDVLVGKTIVDAEGNEVEGTMTNLGSVTTTIDGLSATSVTYGAGYTSGGTISLTDDIETRLAAI
ncbi:MAG: hypothetical protein R3Y49_03110 [Rikenellaceae bacterium]